LNAVASCRSATSYGTNGAGLQRDSTGSSAPALGVERHHVAWTSASGWARAGSPPGAMSGVDLGNGRLGNAGGVAHPTPASVAREVAIYATVSSTRTLPRRGLSFSFLCYRLCRDVHGCIRQTTFKGAMWMCGRQ
jgi:hypothetical protein